MGEHEPDFGDSIEEIDRIGEQELDESEAAAISTRVVEDVVEGFAGHSRVILDRKGDEVSASLRLDPDVDPALFVDQLRGLNEVEVRLDYALSDKPAEQIPEVAVGWRTDLDEGVLVTLHEGEVPVVASWKDELDGERSDSRIEDFNGKYALQLQSVMDGVKHALGEKERRLVWDRAERDEGLN